MDAAVCKTYPGIRFSQLGLWAVSNLYIKMSHEFFPPFWEIHSLKFFSFSYRCMFNRYSIVGLPCITQHRIEFFSFSNEEKLRTISHQIRTPLCFKQCTFCKQKSDCKTECNTDPLNILIIWQFLFLYPSPTPRCI